jgi:SAM-dependent methyltransferase
MDYKDYLLQNKETGRNDRGNHFWYKARREMIDGLLGNVFMKHQTDRLIVEIGCGTGYQLPIVKKWGRAKGLDINASAVAIALKNGFDAEIKDLEKDDIAVDCPEAVCLFDVLEHIKNDDAAIKKIYAILKNRGFLFMTVPAYAFMFSGHDRAMAHFRRYDKKKLINELEAVGFKIIRSGYWNSLLFPAILSMRLFKNFLSFFLKKNTYQSEAVNLPLSVNYFLYLILHFENFLIGKGFRFLWGLSIFIVAKKIASDISDRE